MVYELYPFILLLLKSLARCESISAASAASVNCLIKEPRAPFAPPILLPAFISLANCSTSISIFIFVSFGIFYFTYVVLHALVVVIDLLEHGVDLQAQGFGDRVKGNLGQVFALAHQVNRRAVIHPQQALGVVVHAAQEAVAAFHGRVVALQRQLGWGGEHGVQARGVGPVFFDQELGIDTVVFRLGHGTHALVGDLGAHGQEAIAAVGGVFQLGTDHFAALVQHMLDVVRPEVVFGALGALAAVDVVQHHALREQFGKRLIHFD